MTRTTYVLYGAAARPGSASESKIMDIVKKSAESGGDMFMGIGHGLYAMVVSNLTHGDEEKAVKLYIAKSSADRTEAKGWIDKARAAGFDVYDWTQDPGWEDPTEAKRALGADADLKAVLDADIVWWQLDDSKSEGAALEFGAALAQKLLEGNVSKKQIVASGWRAVRDQAFFTLHPSVNWRSTEHYGAWDYILSIKI